MERYLMLYVAVQAGVIHDSVTKIFKCNHLNESY